MHKISIFEDNILKQQIESDNYIVIALDNDGVSRIHNLDATFVNMMGIYSSLLEVTAFFSKAIKEAFLEDESDDKHEGIQTDPGHWKQ